jgi:hypothetical protein
MNGVKFFPLDHMRMEDMRAREPLKEGDEVQVDGGTRSGILIEFDADRRLARVASAGNRGWYYVKDLTVVRHASKVEPHGPVGGRFGAQAAPRDKLLCNVLTISAKEEEPCPLPL